MAVTRLEQGHKSPEQYSAIGLDRSDQTAIDTLMNMAGKDAEHIHSKALSADRGDLSNIATVFKSLLPLEPKDHNR